MIETVDITIGSLSLKMLAMCRYTYLSKNEQGEVKWCHDCKTYHLTFNNMIMNFKSSAFHQFKDNLNACYQANLNTDFDRDERQILFNTRIDGLQLLFSVNEIGSFLSLMQEATIESMFAEIGT